MSAPSNQTNNEAVNAALDQEFVNNFLGDYNRLAEVLGIFGVDAKRAGATLKQFKITGELNNAKGTDGSSGTAYVEGDLVALSKYKVEPEIVGEIKVIPYRKQTTAQAIASNGYEAAVLRTDMKMLSHSRGSVMTDFFKLLENGTGTATGKTLQAAIALADAALGDATETNGDEAGRIIHFINRTDAFEYLSKAEITVQTLFGMTYLENFLGVTDVFLTNKVAKGKLFVTPVENLHIYGLDFASLADGGLAYTADASGVIGVAHTPAYDHVSVDTNVIEGMTVVPEVKDYIIKSTIVPGA